MVWIIALVLVLFLARLFFVLGKIKSKAERTASDSKEVYALCKATRMNVRDIQSIESDKNAMAWIKEQINSPVSR